MNLLMQRTRYRSDGIFSRVTRQDTGEFVCVTLDHAYPSGLPTHEYLPKVMPGTYRCVLGPHRLHSMTKDFYTYEVTGVKGHTGILFHRGNWNKDSEGCFLVGDALAQTDQDMDGIDGPDLLITNTPKAFERFLQLQDGAPEFMLEVRG